MASDQNSGAPAPGWVGGFEESNPAFAYPDPDLSSLPILDNMANIDKLQRQQQARWPEFSWETIPGEADSRCFQMFAPEISRIGYTNEGRVYSIICPQQGTSSPNLGTLNVEVTVTGQRGWVNEDTRQLAADMGVRGTIWFSPSAKQRPLVKLLWRSFANSSHPFPSSKADAIHVPTHFVGNPDNPDFPVRTGESDKFQSPDFARHEAEAWAVQNLEVQIGSVEKTGDDKVDDFNELVMDIFNVGSGNMLKAGNVLTWNIWSTPPELVDQEEWRTHAERWRASIEADHGSPTGDGTPARYFDGTYFKPLRNLLDREVVAAEQDIAAAEKDLETDAEEELDKIHEFLSKHL